MAEYSKDFATMLASFTDASRAAPWACGFAAAQAMDAGREDLVAIFLLQYRAPGQRENEFDVRKVRDPLAAFLVELGGTLPEDLRRTAHLVLETLERAMQA